MFSGTEQFYNFSHQEIPRGFHVDSAFEMCFQYLQWRKYGGFVGISPKPYETVKIYCDTFKWIKDYELWFQLAGLLSFQDRKEASQVFQIDGVISTGCLVSMPNYTENVSILNDFSHCLEMYAAHLPDHCAVETQSITRRSTDKLF